MVREPSRLFTSYLRRLSEATGISDGLGGMSIYLTVTALGAGLRPRRKVTALGAGL
jgi:hypothetical protein